MQSSILYLWSISFSIHCLSSVLQSSSVFDPCSFSPFEALGLCKFQAGYKWQFVISFVWLANLFDPIQVQRTQFNIRSEIASACILIWSGMLVSVLDSKTFCTRSRSVSYRFRVCQPVLGNHVSSWSCYETRGHDRVFSVPGSKATGTDAQWFSVL